MRGIFFCLWLLFPAAVLAYHYGPGQERLALDDAAGQLSAARDHVNAEEWADAVAQFDAALAVLPEEEVDAVRRVRVERAKAQMNNGQLPAAYDDLTLLVEELEADGQVAPDLERDARLALGNAQYFMTWLMRLEGLPRSEWEPQIEAARQNFRLLAEAASKEADEAVAAARQEDLESAVRLARMDLSDLQALPLPSQCKGCKSGQCKCKGKCKSKRTGEKDARGAGSGPPPDGRGS